MRKIIILSYLLLAISGCGYMKGLEAQANRKKLKYLQIDMTKEQALEAMGEPYKREKYPAAEIWLYITDWQSDGYTTLDEMTPLVFEEDRLVGWGAAYIDSGLNKYEVRLR